MFLVWCENNKKWNISYGVLFKPPMDFMSVYGVGDAAQQNAGQRYIMTFQQRERLFFSFSLNQFPFG